MIDWGWNLACHVIAVVHLVSLFGLRCLTEDVQGIMSHKLKVHASVGCFEDIGEVCDRLGFSCLSWNLEMNVAPPSNFETRSLFGANFYFLTESPSACFDSAATPIEGNGS